MIIIGLSFLTYLLMYISPGDPALKKLNAQGITVSEETLEAAREEMGLNEPFLARYAQWLGNALTGDLGTSYKDGMPVAGKLTHALRYTLILSVASLAVSLIVSLPLAVISAVKKDGILDNIVKLLSFIGNSLPNFLISVLLMYFFCVKTDLLPVLADESVKGLILPCLALAIPMCSRFLRQFRAEVLEQLGHDYVLGAKARGVKSSIILFKNVLHNAAIPILTIVALSIGSLLGGSVVVETIFRWPGIGKLVMDSITARDYPVIQGFVIFTSCIYVLINLAADLCYRRLDPRVWQMCGERMDLTMTARKKQKRRLCVFLTLAGVLMLIGLLAPLIVPNDPNATNAANMNASPSAKYLFGTDRYGRCVFSRVLMGARTSIFSAVVLVAVTFVIGTVLGMIAGWYGGAVDSIIMRIVDIMLAFPQMVLAIAVAGILGGGMINAMLAMGLSGWTLYARLARAQVIAMKNEPFISAARLSGCSNIKIMLHYLLPCMLGSLIVNAATQLGVMMIGIAGLSFLGIGVTEPHAEWGSMINQSRAYMQLAPWATLAPAGATVVTVMIFNCLGDFLRDYLDVEAAK